MLNDDIQKLEVSKDWPPTVTPQIEERIIPQSVNFQ